MNHRIVTRRNTSYPFESYWVCICGTRMLATVMGPWLYREFEAHVADTGEVHPVTQHRRDFPGHSSGEIVGGEEDGRLYCIDCDWDGKEATGEASFEDRREGRKE